MTPSITQTRASLLTAHGVGAVAVIRVEGAFAAETVQSLLQHFRDDRPVVLAHGRPKFARIVDGVEIIDDVVVTADRFGDGFCVDICAHAGVRIVERILACLKNRGCAVDEPAAHHAWDWAAKNQLELEVSELLPLAKSHFAARFLLAQQLLWPEWVAKIGNRIATAPADALGELRDVVERFTIAQRLIHGARIAIVGPPNVGKSTLFNRLVGRPAAIVADQPGTTRDWISTDIELAGLPVTLIDTAGYRTTEDPLEQASIHLGGLTAIQADLCLTVVDPTTMGRLTEFEYSICNENPQSQQESKHHAPEPQASKMLTLKVLNKCETLPDSCPQTEQMETHSDLIAISARNGLGIDVLVERILLALNVPKKPDFAVMPITNRQRSLLCEFLSDVDRTAETWETTAAKLLGVAPCSTESARL